MTTIFHLSDLHFGPKFNAHLADLILEEIQAAHPDLVIVSGDWTMRGRVSEYEQARAYLQKLPRPVLTIPGNHDQPLHWAGLYERLVRPWARYRRFIQPEIDTVYQAPGLCVVGLNDNHNLIPGGVWSAAQRRWMETELQAAPSQAFKILVMHHHLLWEGKWRPAGQWFPTRTLQRLAVLGVELILNGHTHIPLVRETPQGIVIAQSGTTLSGRTRHGHGNAYNRITIDVDQIAVEIYAYDDRGDHFAIRTHTNFLRKLKRQREN
jgi:3',5'-cyclic AMP phosphodiesterase CpdA